MFFLESHKAFRIFKKIADAMKKGSLISSSAKISTDIKPEYRQVICIYTDSFIAIDKIARPVSYTHLTLPTTERV